MELFIILLLTLVNGIFAMSEIAVVSSREARLQQLADEGSDAARMALSLARNPNRFLSTVQIGITLIGIVAGAFGGATIGDQFATWIAATVPTLEPYADALGFAAIVLLTTYLSLVVGELVPKRIGLQQPERIAVLVAPWMRRLSLVAHPVVSFLSFSTNALLRLLGIRPLEQPDITEEEIRLLLRQGTQVGVFDAQEESMVAGVFRLDDLPVAASMTPRVEIDWLDLDDDLKTNLDIVINSEHSSFPVAKGDLDEVIGIVSAKDMLKCHLEGKPIDLHALSAEPLFIPEGVSAGEALERLKTTRCKMALIIGEYGSIVGAVTVRDIIEEVVGDIDDPHAVQRDDGSWLLDGMLPVDELKTTLELADDLPGEDEGMYQSLGGFVLTQMQRVPQVAEHFDWSGYRFEVVDMDGKRIDKVLVRRLTDEERRAREGSGDERDDSAGG